MKAFFSALFVSLVLLACAPGLCPAAEYNFSAAPTIVHNLTVTGTIYIIDDGDTISVYTADSVVTLLLATGRLTGGDVAVTDSIKGVTVDATGKITGGAGLAITGNAAMSGRVTGTDLAVSDSILGVTVDASGKITGATTMAITGASTLTGGIAVGAAASALLVIKYIGDSLAFISASDTTYAFQPGTK